MTRPDPSRRWVLQVGAGTLITGFSGRPGTAAETLPQGLYLPSTDHMAHALKAAANSQPLVDYRPQFFSPEQVITVRRILALLLGDVNNGPRVIGEIVSWIDLIVFDSAAVRAAAKALAAPHRAVAVACNGVDAVERLERFDPQAICREGLSALASDPNTSSVEGMSVVLSRYLTKTAATQDAVGTFLSFLKERALEGYYTSPEGLRELNYKGNSFYVESPGCAHPTGTHA